MLSSNQKINPRILVLLSIILLAVFWCYTLFAVPTFDLDESLYRRAAEEMKLSGNWWTPTWDGIQLNHKPPILYWLIIISSYFIDGMHAGVSVAAARLPSLLCSVGILISLYRAATKNKWTAPLLYLSALFPVLTGTAVIFDPLQTLALLPALFILTEFFKTDLLPSKKLRWVIFSIFTATAIKGLNGIIIPAFAFGLHSVFVLFYDRTKFKSLFTQALKIFIPAALLSILYYLVLDIEMGRNFTKEFFLVHHFGRSQNAMEAHGGSVLYHPLFVWISGCFLGLFLIPKILQKNWGFLKIGFPLTFSLSFIIIFSFSATKLPHYTWPIWAALAFQGSLFDEEKTNSTRFLKIKKYLAEIPILFWIFVFLLLALDPLLWVVPLFKNDQANTVVKYYPHFSTLTKMLFAMGSGFSIAALMSGPAKQKPAFLAVINLLCCLCIGFAATPILNALLFEPQAQISKAILEKHPSKEDCIYYAGPHSPSISLVLGNEIFHNRCKEGQPLKYLVVPEWKLPECKERGFVVLAQAKYLYMCGSGSKN